MQTVSYGDNLHEMLKLILWEKRPKYILKMLSAEFLASILRVKSLVMCIYTEMTKKRRVNFYGESK